MAYKIEIKNDVLERIEKGEKIKHIGEETGISLSTIYKWKKEFEKNYIISEKEKETSKEIRELIKLKKYNEAIVLIEKYPLNMIIQSQRITIAIEKGDFEKAEKIGNRPEFIDNPIIQSQMITIAIEEGNFEKAEKIGNRPEFINNPIIQSQMITIAVEEGDFEKAEKIGNRPEFINNPIIQSQMITIAVEEGDYEKAKEIGSRPEFLDYPPIQSQMIKLAIKEKDYEKAREIGNRPEFINNPIIQSQMITIAVEEGDFEKAKEIGNRPEFLDYPPIQLQMIKLAIKEKDYEKARKIGNRPEFINNSIIQLQIIKLAIKEKDYEKAKEIGNRPEFINDPIIQPQMIEIKIKERQNEFLNEIKTKMYYNKLKNTDIDRIKQNTDITEKQKIYILLSIYERQKNIKEAKRIVKEYKINNKELVLDKNINIILQRIENKKRQIFNWEFYDILLDWQIDENLNAKSIENNYFEEIMQYLIERKKEIYVKMQSNDLKIQREGTEKWNKIKNLIEDTKQNRDNKEYIEILYKKVSKLKDKEDELSK